MKLSSIRVQLTGEYHIPLQLRPNHWRERLYNQTSRVYGLINRSYPTFHNVDGLIARVGPKKPARIPK